MWKTIVRKRSSSKVRAVMVFILSHLVCTTQINLLVLHQLLSPLVSPVAFGIVDWDIQHDKSYGYYHPRSTFDTQMLLPRFVDHVKWAIAQNFILLYLVLNLIFLRNSYIRAFGVRPLIFYQVVLNFMRHLSITIFVTVEFIFWLLNFKCLMCLSNLKHLLKIC